MAKVTDFEFYETPEPFTKWLFKTLDLGLYEEEALFEPCVGNGAIVSAASNLGIPRRSWITNDLDKRWPADMHDDATQPIIWHPFTSGPITWTVTNPPFGPALDIIKHALQYSDRGVAMHLRASIHEVLKTGPRRTFMHDHTPTGILWLPRFAYQRSRSKGTWTTDSVCACWVIWERGAKSQYIRYAPEWVLDELFTFTPPYRERMDHLMGFTGTEAQRQKQCVEFWKSVEVAE